MSEPLAPVTLDDAIDSAADELASSWDRITEVKVDEDSGMTQLVVADEPPAAPAEPPPAAPAPGTVGEPPAADRSYAEVRKWATQASQKNAELAAEVDALKRKDLDAQAALDKDEFVERFANALAGQDMAQITSDPRAFAKVVTVAADRIAQRQTSALQVKLDEAQQALQGMGQAIEFVTAMNPEFGELQPIIANAAQAYAAQNGGANLFHAYTYNDVLAAARAFRDQARGQQQPAQQATTVQGQAPPPPPAAPQREARPVSKAASAASAEGYAVDDRTTRDLGRKPATGRNAFNANIRGVLDDIFSEPQTG